MPGQAGQRPPRDLNCLLSDVESREDITRLPWLKAFADHLRSSKQSDLEFTLDFVVAAHVLRHIGEQIQRDQWKRCVFEIGTSSCS